MMWNQSGMMGQPIGGLLLTLLVFAGGAALVVYLLRRSGSSDATSVLAERYARGEIDDEEYQRRLDHLQSL
jgi:putative membrane protein